MADERLRNLERSASQGDVEDAARLMAERIRAGALPRERVELLAFLGDPAAQVLAEEEPGADAADNLREWVWSLVAWGSPVVVRALLAAARLVLPESGPDLFDVEDALTAVTAYCDDPRPDHADALASAAGYALRAAENLAGEDQQGSVASFAVYYTTRTARLAAAGEPLKPFLHQAALALRTTLLAGASEREVAEAVRRELREWAETNA